MKPKERAKILVNLMGDSDWIRECAPMIERVITEAIAEERQTFADELRQRIEDDEMGKHHRYLWVVDVLDMIHAIMARKESESLVPSLKARIVDERPRSIE